MSINEGLNDEELLIRYSLWSIDRADVPDEFFSNILKGHDGIRNLLDSFAYDSNPIHQMNLIWIHKLNLGPGYFDRSNPIVIKYLSQQSNNQ